MNVQSILGGKGSNVATIAQTATLHDAVHQLGELGIGALVVSNDGRTIDGIISERDIVRATAAGGSAAFDDTVASTMSSDVVTCSAGDGVDRLMSLMTDRRIRHLPVTDDDGNLTGIVSIGDVVKARLTELEHENEALSQYISGRDLAAPTRVGAGTLDPMPSRPFRRGLRWYFDHNDGRLIDKWDHYFEIYESHFRPFRRRRPVVLELGVAHGGSLQMWRHYFGRGSTIVGVDIEPRVAALGEPGIDVHVGSQGDPDLLASLVERYGRFDIVIDDGSHRFEHQMASLGALWDALQPGGVYLVEDVHSSYMRALGNTVGSDDTFIATTKHLIDDLHGYWFEGGAAPTEARATEWTRTLGAIHVYDSIVVLDKAHHGVPRRRRTGRPAFDTIHGFPAEEMIDEAHRAQLAALQGPAARIRRLRHDPIATLRGFVGRRWPAERRPTT